MKKLGKFSQKAKKWQHARENDKTAIVFIDGKKEKI
jgi:hypothetical protein